VRDYDWSEAWDIYHILKSLGIKGGVVDIGCGEGQLIRYLRSRGITAVGCDINGGCGMHCDATRPGTIPRGRAWVLQHVIEHIPTDAWHSLFKNAYEAGIEYVIIIAPGHFTNDATHMCNHITPLPSGVYEGEYGKVAMCGLNDLKQALREVGYAGVASFIDTHSLMYPWDLDWIIIASRDRHALRKLLPWILKRKFIQLKTLFTMP